MSPWEFIKGFFLPTEEDIELTISEILGFILWLIISTVVIGFYLIDHWNLNISNNIFHIVCFFIGFVLGLISSPIGRYVGQFIILILEIIIDGLVMLFKNES